MSSINFPKLRWPLEIQKTIIKDEKVVILKCPIGISNEPLALKDIAIPVLSKIDGTREIDQILREVSHLGFTVQHILDLLNLLDTYYFLESPRFESLNFSVRGSYSSLKIREPFFGDSIYPKDKNLLDSLIKNYLNANQIDKPLPTSSLKLLVSPHIDYQRGGDCYGTTYNALKNQAPDLIILIGTCHKYSSTLFQLTDKEFVSPLGFSKNPSNYLKKISTSYGEKRSFEDEFLHKAEHSLELQLPFIHYFFPSIPVLPILVGSFHEMVLNKKLPSDYAEYQDFISGFTESLDSMRKDHLNYLIIAGVDMAHIGRQFGDVENLSEEKMLNVKNRDAQYLKHVLDMNNEALFYHIAEDNDARRMCGFPTLYTVIDAFNRINIKLSSFDLGYNQSVDYKTQCAVTFSGLGFYES